MSIFTDWEYIELMRLNDELEEAEAPKPECWANCKWRHCWECPA